VCGCNSAGELAIRVSRPATSQNPANNELTTASFGGNAGVQLQAPLPHCGSGGTRPKGRGGGGLRRCPARVLTRGAALRTLSRSAGEGRVDGHRRRPASALLLHCRL